MDPWAIGSLNKLAIWICYITFNVVGIALCTATIKRIRTRPDRDSPANTFATMLMLGCIWMSATCAGQCLLSAIENRFFGQEWACNLEAIFHVSGILTQFWAVTLLSCYVCAVALFHFTLTPRQAHWIAALTTLGCIVVTTSLAAVSPIYLMSAGTYCFFQFRSPAISYWLLPALALAMACIIVAFASVLWVTNNAIDKVAVYSPGSAREHQQVQHRFAIRSSASFGTLLVGWSPAAAASVFELISFQEAPEWLVTLIGVCGTFHSIMAALVLLWVIKTKHFNDDRVETMTADSPV